MGIVAGKTGSGLLDDMLPVHRETLVTQNAFTVVAFIAEIILLMVFREEIIKYIISLQDKMVFGPVRTFGSRGIVIVVAIAAIDYTGFGVRLLETGNVGIPSGGLYRMTRGSGGIEQAANIFVSLGNSDNPAVTAVTELVFELPFLLRAPLRGTSRADVCSRYAMTAVTVQTFSPGGPEQILFSVEKKIGYGVSELHRMTVGFVEGHPEVISLVTG